MRNKIWSTQIRTGIGAGRFETSRVHDGSFQTDRMCLEASENSTANDRSYLHETRILRGVGRIEGPLPISRRFNQNGIYLASKNCAVLCDETSHWTKHQQGNIPKCQSPILMKFLHKCSSRKKYLTRIFLYRQSSMLKG